MLFTLLLWPLFLLSVQAAFVRRWECGPSDQSLNDPIFRQLTLDGAFKSTDNTTTLNLQLTGQFTSRSCDSLDGSSAQMVVDARVLGRSVGYQGRTMGTCVENLYRDHSRTGLRDYAIYQTSYYFNHTYALHTLDTTIRLRLDGSEITCVAAHITPYIGSTASVLLKAVPFIIMVLFGLATGPLKICRRNGRSMFRYELDDSSNDPAQSHVQGLGDCLQYLQFIFLSGSLTLAYPGFYQAIVSQLAWSSLIFKNWPVTHQFAYPGVMGGFYSTNSTWGLEEMSQVLGGTTLSDLWVNAIVNLILVILGTAVIMQIPFLSEWIPRSFRTRQSAALLDFRTESLTQFQRTGWSVIRTVLDRFLLPIVAYSSFQPMLASWFPVYWTFMAVSFVGFLAVSLGFTVWYLAKNDRQSAFFRHTSFPRRQSRDWFSSALYGVPIIRGVAIGGLQHSGLSQIIVLIACEVLILGYMLWNCRHGPVWRHTCFSVARLASIAMICGFIPNAAVSERSKGLLAYSILLVHAGVLLLGFLGPCLVDVARFSLQEMGLIKSPADDVAPSNRAPVFGIGQLSHRSTRNISFTELPALRPAAYTDRTGVYAPDPYPSFFRPPRPGTPGSSSRSLAPSKLPSQSGSESGESTESSMDSVDLSVLDSEIGTERSDVDYSKREADQYYGRPMVARRPADPERADEHPASAGSWRWHRQSKTKGFEVLRPGRRGL
ncbi:uncharacterized protein BO80DRAFT_246029 [Aspergillus ibericus CBS 121593]|uniref:Uncharacterized protein n=1 Tax=Aspergillus ibericus CBS 121593 TaxID=1448316 RepID=A0A395GM23_9EURO|nr:hypothetical protein BO80DRAFT_246029 [Aspergillus ibericus CBS 121593]RAK95877.1 hypothetical protein BO80DRAFT_246029 [Aspergillus ibericus CBS 121593]